MTSQASLHEAAVLATVYGPKRKRPSAAHPNPPGVMDTRTSSRTRRIVAFVGHAPALRLCYRQRLSPQLRRANAIAAGLTLIVLLVALFLAPPTINKLSVTLVVWAPCHMAWGAYLAWRL